MIDGLKPYAAYRESGVPWLGRVPEHWDVRRLRNAAEMRVSNVDKHTKDDEHPVRLCNYVDVYKNDRIIDSLKFMRATATSGEIERFRLEIGDVLITKDSETWDDIGVPALVEQSANDLICGYHLALLRPRNHILRGGYLFRALQSKPVAYQFHVEANGVTRYGLSHAAIQSISLPIPPLPEQAAIVRFLDHADRLIRRYIRAKKKLIALLSEQKQVIIHRAVTRGLDPNVKFKPSRIAWLGDVPEGWEVVPLRRRWSVTDCKHLTVPFVDEGIPLASVREVQSFEVTISKAKRTTMEWYHHLIEYGRAPRRGDLIYCRNVSVGAAAIVNTEEPFAMGQDVCLIRSLDQNQRYLNYYLRSGAMKYQLAQLLVGSTFNRINVAEIKGLIVVVPLRAEQDLICDYLDDTVSHIDKVIEYTILEIDLVREFRTRLIADIVTGKLDVRQAAAHLPAESEEPEGGDEFEELPEDAEAIDDSDLEEASLEAGP
jgi:type I restriction enzyme S subunit